MIGDCRLGESHRQQTRHLVFAFAQSGETPRGRALGSKTENAQDPRCLFAAAVLGLAMFFGGAVPSGPGRTDIHDDVEQMRDAARAAQRIDLPVPTPDALAMFGRT